MLDSGLPLVEKYDGLIVVFRQTGYRLGLFIVGQAPTSQENQRR